jgi:hypothetical protein
VLFGAGNANAGGHRDFSVLLSVKNVAGLENALYEVRQPKSWDTAPRRHGDDGIDEVVLETPLSLTSARNSGEWYWWNIKISQVAPSRTRNRVSSFFTRTTGDGSVPGEFRRLGVSIVRDSNRVYRTLICCCCSRVGADWRWRRGRLASTLEIRVDVTSGEE